ncbi:MAG: metallophosphoesterase family protein [Candidatus Sedimenticola sp. (ex Thyasira tokunagai)]
MATKIGIISDPHATPGPVEEALSIFRQEGVERILCAGDIAGYGDSLDETVALLAAHGCQSVIGNHEAWYLDRTIGRGESLAYRYLSGLPLSLKMEVEGKMLYMVHASPPDSLMDGIRLLDEQGELVDRQLIYWTDRLQGLTYDLLVVGHTHQVFAESMAATLVINPGSTLCNHSCAVVSFPALQVHWYSLSSQPLLKSWNWGVSRL